MGFVILGRDNDATVLRRLTNADRRLNGFEQTKETMVSGLRTHVTTDQVEFLADYQYRMQGLITMNKQIHDIQPVLKMYASRKLFM